MNRRSYLGVLLLALPFCTSAIAQTAPQYALVDLGETDYSGQGMIWADRSLAFVSPDWNWPTLAPCTAGNQNTYTTPQFFNGSLTVSLGKSCTTTGAHAVMWTGSPETPATLTDIGVLPGALADESGALGSNEVGDVVGGSATAFTTSSGTPAFHGFLWNSGHFTNLGSIAGNTHNSTALAVNSSHEVLGTTETISSTDGSILTRVFVFTNGTMYNLTFFTVGGPTALLTEAKWIDCQGNISVAGFPINKPGLRHSYLLVRQGPARTCKDY
jgi:hypothetical protein